MSAHGDATKSHLYSGGTTSAKYKWWGNSLVASFMKGPHPSAGCGRWSLTSDPPPPLHFIGAAAGSWVCSISAILYHSAVYGELWLSSGPAAC